MSDLSLKSNKQDLVSVIIPTLNAGYLINDLLRTLADQTYKNIEVIINDDPRTNDNTKEVIEKYKNQLNILYIQENNSLGQARNSGAKKANGEYLLHLDADFQLTKEVVEECLKKLENAKTAHPQLKGIIIPEEVIGEGFWSKCKWLEKKMYNGDDTIESARFYETKAYWEVGGHDPEMSLSEDKDMDLRFREKYEIDRIQALIFHNERKISFFKNMRRKFFWAQSAETFIKKQTKHSVKQGNVLFRPAYFRNWKLILKHPILFTGIFVMKFSEILAVVTGIVFNKLGFKVGYRN